MSGIQLVLRDALTRIRHLGAAAVVSLALLAGAGGSALASDGQVVILQPSEQLAWRFDPASVSVSAGSSVTWVNQGTAAMTVTSPEGLFDSGEIPAGGSYTATFDTPGSFRYFCVAYPHMKGVVVVTPEPASTRDVPTREPSATPGATPAATREPAAR